MPVPITPGRKGIDMATVRDVIAYLCARYPHKGDLSKARLAKMVYLADWRSALERRRQVTDVEWEFNYYGPYVNDIVSSARADSAFDVQQTVNICGGPKEIVRVRSDVEYPSLTEEDTRILDIVIASVAAKSWDDFIRLVYSTYPIVTQPRFSKLNLVELAEQYKNEEALYSRGRSLVEKKDQA
jgi:Protein of unknown function (DUF4065)